VEVIFYVTWWMQCRCYLRLIYGWDISLVCLDRNIIDEMVCGSHLHGCIVSTWSYHCMFVWVLVCKSAFIYACIIMHTCVHTRCVVGLFYNVLAPPSAVAIQQRSQCENPVENGIDEWEKWMCLRIKMACMYFEHWNRVFFWTSCKTCYLRLRHCLHSNSASTKPGSRRRATLIIFVMKVSINSN